jgi:hypothetical protein
MFLELDSNGRKHEHYVFHGWDGEAAEMRESLEAG